MRLGLVGRGPQARRYLEPKNGGAGIVSQVPGLVGVPEFQDWLETVDAVVIATHPAGHRHLALDAIAAGKGVLIEKPLALNLEDCEQIIDAAEAAGVPFDVAHTHLWSEAFPHVKRAHAAHVDITYTEHTRDYSPWLDWGPHIIAMLEASGAPEQGWTLEIGKRRSLLYAARDGAQITRMYTGLEPSDETAMARMMREFPRLRSYEFNRRVYRSLFAMRNHATSTSKAT